MPEGSTPPTSEPRSPRGRAWAALLALALVLAACGGGADDDSASTTTDPDTTEAADDAADDDSAGDDSAGDDSAGDDETTTTTDNLEIPGAPDALDGMVDDGTIKILGGYAVDGDEIVGEADPDHAEVWDRFTHLFPAETHPEIVAFVAIDMDASYGTDGALQTSALDPAERYIALDVTGADSPEELDRTMIHEFAHLLSLRPSQVPVNPDAVDGCDVYTDYDGCPIQDAYLRAFAEQYWTDYLVSDEDDEGPDAVDDRYEDDESAYVTDYAATNPAEDLAEVFAEWVLADEPATGDTVADEKLQFWEDYPEVVTLRDDIRTALDA